MIVLPGTAGVEKLVVAVLTSATDGLKAGDTGVGSFSPASLPCPSPSGSAVVPLSDRSLSCGLMAWVCPESAPTPVTVA